MLFNSPFVKESPLISQQKRKAEFSENLERGRRKKTELLNSKSNQYIEGGQKVSFVSIFTFCKKIKKRNLSFIFFLSLSPTFYRIEH